MNTIELNRKFGLQNSLMFQEENGLKTALINNRFATCEVALYGAQVLSYTPREEEDILMVSSHFVFREGVPIRGGIPLCFPWFGVRPDDTQLPGHGFARLVTWEVKSTDQLISGATRLGLALSDNELTQRYWSCAFECKLEIIVGEELSLQWHIRNRDEVPFQITNAFHSYLNVGDVTKIEVTGLENVPYLEEIRSEEPFNGEGQSITFFRETDRIYTDTTSGCRIVDAALKRTILIRKTGSLSTVVWNPWEELAMRISDLGDEDFKRFVCVETANVLHNAVTIDPGETHVMSMDLLLE